MKTLAETTAKHPSPLESGAGIMGIKRSVRSFLRGTRALVAAISEGMRRIRAYNDLQRLNTRTLQDLGTHQQDLDRVLRGQLPRPHGQDRPDRG